MKYKSYSQAILHSELLTFLSPIVTDANGLFSTLTVLIINNCHYHTQELVYSLLYGLGYNREEIFSLVSAYSEMV